jgi:hypothetical protein
MQPSEKLKIPNRSVPILIEEVCKEEKLKYWIEPEYKYIGWVISPSGKKHFFNNSTLNINFAGSVKITKDKDYCSKILQQS